MLRGIDHCFANAPSPVVVSVTPPSRAVVQRRSLAGTSCQCSGFDSPFLHFSVPSNAFTVRLPAPPIASVSVRTVTPRGWQYPSFVPSAGAAREQAGMAERVDALDNRRESGAQALGATSVTVNVGQSAAGATETGGRLSEGGHVATLDPSNTEIGVSALLVDGAKSSAEIARTLGVSSSAVRMTDAWKNRVKEQA